jgi:drug/metabolite transporter (DMT)-like permease
LLNTLIAYITIYLVWGATYYFIKLAVQTIDPMYVVGFRFLLGGAGLLCFYFITHLRKRKTGLTLKQFLNAACIGILLLIGGNGLVTYAEKTISSYVAALLISTTPIAVLILDRVLFRKKTNVFAITGAVIGITGTILLLNKGNQILPEIKSYDYIILGAVFLWALGTTLSKKLTLPEDVVLNAGIQSMVAGGISIIAWQFFHPLQSISFSAISNVSYFSLLFLIVVGSLAFVAYGYLLKHEPNHRIVSYSLVNPLIAVLIGIFIGKEEKAPLLIPSLVCILFGLFLLFYGEKIWKEVIRACAKITRHFMLVIVSK